MKNERSTSRAERLRRVASELRVASAPLDVVQFARQELGLKLYPRQQFLLRLLYLGGSGFTSYDHRVLEELREAWKSDGDVRGVPPDTPQRVDRLLNEGYGHFREAVLIFGRRASKTMLAAIVAAYEIHLLVNLGCPQDAMGIDPRTPLVLSVLATTLTQSRDVGLRTISSLIEDAPCFRGRIAFAGAEMLKIRTPFDEQRLADLRSAGAPVEETATIWVTALSSNAGAARGTAAFMAIFDEMAFLPGGLARTGQDLYDAIKPALDQTKKRGLVLHTTSPYQKIGMPYKVYTDALATDPATGLALNHHILPVVMTSWDPYLDWDNMDATNGEVLPEPPQIYDDLLKAEERRDPEAFRVERRAQWAEVESPFLSAELVEAMFWAYCDKCGQPARDADWEAADGACPSCGQITKAVRPEHRTRGALRHVYEAHSDPSHKRDHWAMVIAHMEEFIEPDGTRAPHVVVDHLGVWKPEDFANHRIDYDVVRAQTVDLVMRFRTLKKLTFDQFGAVATIAQTKADLRARGHEAKVDEWSHTASEARERNELMRELLSRGWVHVPPDRFGPDGACLLELEAKFLQIRGDRVDTPTFGPITHDDLWVALGVCCLRLITEAYGSHWLERLRNLHLVAGLPGGYHSGTLPDGYVARSLPGRSAGAWPALHPAKDMLPLYGQRRSKGIPYGMYDPERRPYLLPQPPSPAERRRGRPIVP